MRKSKVTPIRARSARKLTRPNTQPKIPSLWRLPRVMEVTGLKQEMIYRLCRSNPPEFPTPRKLGKHATAWRSDEIEAWIESRPLAPLNPVGASAPTPQ